MVQAKPRFQDKFGNVSKPPKEKVKDHYRFFAEKEVRGRCQIYEDIGMRIAEDPDLIEMIATFPKNKRQPNLILASLRKFLGHVPTFEEVRMTILDKPKDLMQIIFSHSTQTNEPGRCATLLPLLCRLPQPLALLEIGPSAGLCLIPDRYNYAIDNTLLFGNRSNPDFILHCDIHGPVPVPKALPQITWRAGLDRNPLDVHDPEQREWLETLVWPSEHNRLSRLRAAMDLATTEELWIEKGDLHTKDLDRLCGQAPKDATLVVFHSAVLSYTLDKASRDVFARRIGNLADFWLSNESPTLFSNFGNDLVPERPKGDFLMALNGRPMAWADPHGASLTWIERAEPI